MARPLRGPQGLVQRAGLSGGGAFAAWRQAVDRQVERQGHNTQEGALCWGSPTAPGAGALGPQASCLSVLLREDAAPGEQRPGSLGPGCALRGSSVGTKPEEARPSSVSPCPPRQTLLHKAQPLLRRSLDGKLGRLGP